MLKGLVGITSQFFCCSSLFFPRLLKHLQERFDMMIQGFSSGSLAQMSVFFDPAGSPWLQQGFTA